MKVVAPKNLHIFTDGGCLPKGTGAWAFAILESDLASKIAISKVGQALATTCNRMEMTAAIEALKYTAPHIRATIWTDSRVLLEIIEIKRAQWKANGWLRARGQQVIDLDLVQELDRLLENRQVTWRWVRAHSGHPINEYCDQLCRRQLGLSLSPAPVSETISF